MPPLGPFKAVIFDMDGLLLDSETLYKRAMLEACADLGFEMPEHLHNAQVGVPHDVGDRLMREFFGAAFPLDRYNTYVRELMQVLTADGVPLKPGVTELLFELNTRGIPTAVATSTSRPTAPDRLEKAGILDSFATVVTRSDVTNGKPHPEPYLTAAARLGMTPQTCLALEDSFTGIRSAHAAGTMPVMVPDQLQPSAEIEKLCHAVLPSLHHVREAAFGLTV